MQNIIDQDNVAGRLHHLKPDLMKTNSDIENYTENIRHSVMLGSLIRLAQKPSGHRQTGWWCRLIGSKERTGLLPYCRPYRRNGLGTYNWQNLDYCSFGFAAAIRMFGRTIVGPREGI